jgi:hypothetical protein
LVEQQSDLSGGNWVVSATYLKGVGLVRRNNEFHHFDVLGTAGVITNASGTVLSTNVYDAFGVSRYVSGNAQTQWRASAGYTEVEGLLANCYIVAELALGLALGCMPLVSPCDRNKRNPDPTMCHDCCDEKIVEDLEKKLTKGKVGKCVKDCDRQHPGDPHAIVECVRGCLVPIGSAKGLLMKIKKYLECCYAKCLPDGDYDPPGECKLP